LKITAIKEFLPTIDFRPRFIVKIETDLGIHGVGEAGTAGRELALKGTLEHFRRFLIGKDPRRIEDLNQIMYRAQYYEGGTVITAAASAIDIALWDILGKYLKAPVWQLMGGATRNKVVCFSDAIAGEGSSYSEKVADLIKKGWNTIRFTPEMPGFNFDQLKEGIYEPWESINCMVEQLRDVRRHVGSKPNLAVDFHHRLNIAQAAEFCRRIEDVGLMFLEEPIRSESPDAYDALRKMTNMPFAIGEEFSGSYVFAPFIEKGLCNYIRLDVCNVGGLTAARKIAAMAEAHYIDIIPHNPLGPIATAAAVHLCIATSNFSMLEFNWTARERADGLFLGTMKLEKDSYPLPTDFGLGITIDEDMLNQYPFRAWEPPHWRRKDGSFTNW
jgi:galactonate dehydratase